MDSILIDNTEYLFVSDVMEITKCADGAKTAREFIKNKKIDNSVVNYVRKRNSGYFLTNGKSNRYDVLCIELSSVKKIFGLDVTIRKKIRCGDADYFSKVSIKNVVHGALIDGADAKFITIDKNRWSSENPGTSDIETRGKPKIDGIYFKAIDVGLCFKIPSIINIITGDGSALFSCLHYVYISRDNHHELYLTYEGLVAISSTPIMKSYVQWIKQNLKDAEETKNLVDGSIVYAYVITLGTVGDLRDIMKIDKQYDDSHFVVKYGTSDDLMEMIKVNGFEKYFPQLKYGANINSNDARECEHKMGKVFGNYPHFIYRKNKMAVVSKKQLGLLEDNYEYFEKKYAVE